MIWLSSPMGALQTVAYLAIVGLALAGLAATCTVAGLRHLVPAWREADRLQVGLVAVTLAYATLYLVVGGLAALVWALLEGYAA